VITKKPGSEPVTSGPKIRRGKKSAPSGGSRRKATSSYQSSEGGGGGPLLGKGKKNLVVSMRPGSSKWQREEATLRQYVLGGRGSKQYVKDLLFLRRLTKEASSKKKAKPPVILLKLVGGRILAAVSSNGKRGGRFTRRGKNGGILLPMS